MDCAYTAGMPETNAQCSSEATVSAINEHDCLDRCIEGDTCQGALYLDDECLHCSVALTVKAADDTDPATQVWHQKNEAGLKFNYPDKVGRTCTTRPCPDGGFHILNEYGECEECGASAFPDAIARTCTKSTCAAFEILTAEGVCEECTEPYTYPSQYDGRSCLTQTCSSNFDVLRETGLCEECTGKFYIPDALKKR